MMTTRVTKTSVNSFVEKTAPCDEAAAATRSTAPRLLTARSGQPWRHRAERELGLDVPVAQVVQRERVVEQHARAGRPDQRPQPVALGLAGEHGAVALGRERPQRGRVAGHLDLGIRRSLPEPVARVRADDAGMPGAETDTRLLGHDDELAAAAERARAGKAADHGAGAFAVVA